MVLGNGEYIICRIRKHWINYLLSLPFCVVLIGFYFLLRLHFDEIILTNRQFYVRTGIIAREVVSTPLSKINNVSYGQSFLERLFDCGTIYVQSANLMGGSGYSYIRYPDRVKAMIEQAMDAREEGKII